MVNVIDTSTYQVSNIATAAGPRRLAITPGGDRIFATDYLGNSVSVIDTSHSNFDPKHRCRAASERHRPSLQTVARFM
jgi:DNA-binding beta-propeller fold protein YncE